MIFTSSIIFPSPFILAVFGLILLSLFCIYYLVFLNSFPFLLLLLWFVLEFLVFTTNFSSYICYLSLLSCSALWLILYCLPSNCICFVSIFFPIRSFCVLCFLYTSNTDLIVVASCKLSSNLLWLEIFIHLRNLCLCKFCIIANIKSFATPITLSPFSRYYFRSVLHLDPL